MGDRNMGDRNMADRNLGRKSRFDTRVLHLSAIHLSVCFFCLPGAKASSELIGSDDGAVLSIGHSLQHNLCGVCTNEPYRSVAHCKVAAAGMHAAEPSDR